jgi:cytoskeleton protein RodZ
VKTEKNIDAAENSDVSAAQPASQASEVAAKSEEKTAKTTKVGAMLKEMRLRKGVKAADIAKKLCIRKHYLDAIEESNYDALPPLPYGIGFIRSYANFLGLNGENIVELYKEETHVSEPKDMHVLEPQAEASMPGIQYLLISIAAIIAVYACWAIFTGNDDTSINESPVAEQNVANTPSDNNNDSGVVVVEEFNFETPQTEETAAEDEATTPTETDEQVTISEDKYIAPVKTVAPTKVEATPDTKAETPKEVKTLQADKAKAADIEIPQEGVFVKVVKETWVEVKDADKLYLSKVLHAGNTYKVPEGKGMILSLGNYDGAEVYVNGKLTKVARPEKKTNIALDGFLDNQH